MKETIEHNNRFYGEELKTENEQLKEWLIIANKHNEELQKERDMYKSSFETMSENYFKLENIIKEVREYIMTTSLDIYNYYKQDYINELITEYNDNLLDILGSDSK